MSVSHQSGRDVLDVYECFACRFTMSESQDFKDSKGGEKLEDVFKVVLIGDALVGKTSLVLRYTEDRFRTNLMSTIGQSLGGKGRVIATCPPSPLHTTPSF